MPMLLGGQQVSPWLAKCQDLALNTTFIGHFITREEIQLSWLGWNGKWEDLRSCFYFGHCFYDRNKGPTKLKSINKAWRLRLGIVSVILLLAHGCLWPIGFGLVQFVLVWSQLLFWHSRSSVLGPPSCVLCRCDVCGFCSRFGANKPQKPVIVVPSVRQWGTGMWVGHGPRDPPPEM